jgi:hypothetical protein
MPRLDYVERDKLLRVNTTQESSDITHSGGSLEEANSQSNDIEMVCYFDCNCAHCLLTPRFSFRRVVVLVGAKNSHQSCSDSCLRSAVVQ